MLRQYFRTPSPSRRLGVGDGHECTSIMTIARMLCAYRCHVRLIPRDPAFCKPYHGDLNATAVIFRPMNRFGLAVNIILFLSPIVCMGEDTVVPAYVVELPESVTDVLIADTESATLHRFGRSESGIVNIEQRYMSIGQNGVGKQRAWDRKTPLGVYFITERLDTSNLAAKYGIAAYPLDYPNAWDRHKERTGDGIWLHGVDANGLKRPPRDTDGCLALPNEELMSLSDTLQPLTTPVIVARELKLVHAGRGRGITHGIPHCAGNVEAEPRSKRRPGVLVSVCR